MSIRSLILISLTIVISSYIIFSDSSFAQSLPSEQPVDFDKVLSDQIIRWYDSELNVHCYIYSNSISCVN